MPSAVETSSKVQVKNLTYSNYQFKLRNTFFYKFWQIICGQLSQVRIPLELPIMRSVPCIHPQLMHGTSILTPVSKILLALFHPEEKIFSTELKTIRSSWSYSIKCWIMTHRPPLSRGNPPLVVNRLPAFFLRNVHPESGQENLQIWFFLDSDDDIVSGNGKPPDLVVLHSDDDIVSGNRSGSDIENGIFEEIARLESLSHW